VCFVSASCTLPGDEGTTYINPTIAVALIKEVENSASPYVRMPHKLMPKRDCVRPVNYMPLTCRRGEVLRTTRQIVIVATSGICRCCQNSKILRTAITSSGSTTSQFIA